ncbi:Polygalacturonase [Pyrenophora teres f. maculata]|nr:Polygalacturonase [Pyrenophora teres f. maculata]
MVGLTLVSLLLSASALVSAAPTTIATRQSCTFTDAATAIKNKAACSTIILNGIAVPAGVTLDLTGLNKGTTVTFQGHTTFAHQALFAGPLISISGTGLVVNGAAGHIIDGGGPAYWDGKGSNGETKPKFFFAHNMISSTISKLNVLNTPVQGFSISNSQQLTLDHITIDNSAGDVGKLGHNTDAFDVGTSSDIFISNSNVKNQDDCMAVNSGTNIHFTNNICSGGHGISIGSVGLRSNNVVKTVVVSGCTVADSTNGVRIKTIVGATGSVSDVTFKDITLSRITQFGLVIRQDYLNGGPTGNPTNGVPITGLTIQNVKGTVTSSGENYFVLCGDGSCSNWSWSGNSITGGGIASNCKSAPKGVSCS